jgi:hypothetical protein
MPRAPITFESTNEFNLVAIGLRAKTARAIAVVLGGSIDSPLVVTKTELRLADPKFPATAQPYHEVMDLSWDNSQIAVKTAAAQIESIAKTALGLLMEELHQRGMKILGVGIVGAKDRDLARIGNPHIRAHAAEGILFRRVLNSAAAAQGLPGETFPDREFDAIAKERLGRQLDSVKRKVSDLGRTVGPPWRADEKQAATAAWLVLHHSLQNRQR